MQASIAAHSVSLTAPPSKVLGSQWKPETQTHVLSQFQEEIYAPTCHPLFQGRGGGIIAAMFCRLK